MLLYVSSAACLLQLLQCSDPEPCMGCFWVQNWGKDGFYGPSYALLQGGLYELSETPPREATSLTLVR
jgi:hypothetical protein